MAVGTILNRRAACAAIVLLLAACSSPDDVMTGKLKLAVTDAAVDNATAVVVQFDGVIVKPGDGEARTFTFDTPQQIDLLALNGGGSTKLLDGVTLPAGRYNWIRLMVPTSGPAGSITLTDGTVHYLEIPSGAETGLKLVSGFVVPAGGTADFTVDFDLRKSVNLPMSAGSPYVLKPALRLVDNTEVGMIQGTVSNTLITSGCTPAVYVFEGANATPDDIDGDAGDPVTTATVHADGTYTAAFLLPGAYTLAFTCQAAADDPATNDTLSFTAAQNVTVVANQTTMANLP